MAIYFLPKDKDVRKSISRVELLLIRRKFFSQNKKISFLAKQRLSFCFMKRLHKVLPYSVRSRNRCVISGRAGSVFRFFRLSRISLKNLASRGILPGLVKASW